MMKRPKVDYGGFSLRRIREPRFSHLLLLGGWLIYFAFYFITENLIPEGRLHVIHCGLDDLIPFNEYFVIFYAGWYLFVAGGLLYALLHDADAFRKMQTYIIVTQALGVIIYLVYPSVQLLRPAVFPRDNVFTRILGLIYAFDTNTGVFPSMHVAFSLAVLSAGLKDRWLSAGAKTAMVLMVVMVCLSVCFVKQHSALDVFGALPVCLIAEAFTYGRSYWLPRIAGKKDPDEDPAKSKEEKWEEKSETAGTVRI